jgi:hypothetical protein
LQEIKGTKKDDISSRICEAQEIVAGAYGLTILPAMKWSVEERFDNFNFIPLFIGSVASDIRSYENERECESWLKNVGQEKFASKRVGQLLVAFDDAYKKLKSQFSKPTFKGQFSNSIIIVTGNSGFGIHSEKHYLDFLEKQNNILKYNNTILLFVRGNNDDPSFFNEKKIDLSNIKALPDFSIVETKDKVILCIGGAISVDRTWKIDQEKRINAFADSPKKRLYWNDEAPVLDIDKLKEVVSNTERIDFVVSHTAPSFATPSYFPISDEWAKKDTQLAKDIDNERLTMDKIFEFLRDNDRRPTYWAYSRFDLENLEKRSNVIFRSLMRGFNFVNTAEDVFKNELMSKLKGKKSNGKVLKKMPDHPFAMPNPIEDRWQNDDMMVGELAHGEDIGEEIAEELPDGNVDAGEVPFPADAGMAVAEAPMNEAQVEAPQAAPDINGRVWPTPDVATVRTTIENNAANGVYFADYMPNYADTLRAENIETLRAHNEALLNRIRGNG